MWNKEVQPDYKYAQLPKMKKIRVFTAILNQSGEEAPTANVLQNTIGVDFVFTREGVGQYKMQGVGAKFEDGKTWAMANASAVAKQIRIDDGGENVRYINQNVTNGLAYVDGMYNVYMEVRVYDVTLPIVEEA